MVGAGSGCDDGATMETSTPSGTPATAPPATTPFRRATRNSTDPVLGGVASGVAEHLGLPVLWVRLGFVVACLLNGLGVALYAALWMFLPSDARFEQSAPGLESARRQGRRPARQGRFRDLGPAVALAVVGIGVLAVLQLVLGTGVVLIPLVIAGAGVALLWRQADEAQRARWFDVDGRIDPVRAVLGDGSWSAWLRIGAGALLVVLAVSTFAVERAGLEVAREVWLATLVALAGVAVVVGPWLLRLGSDLGAERAERIRSQERADVAAHLHDSVLQTLALIQRNAGDPTAVTRLARGQERDLRAWLYTGEESDASTLTGALREVASRVEAEHDLAVHLVTVGDSEEMTTLRPLVQAVGEALVNVAKHAGVASVDVYAECGAGQAEVFVRDRGVGFDTARVASDRHGVRRSIVGRMERHGGRASVRSAPGEGTEVRLALPLES